MITCREWVRNLDIYRCRSWRALGLKSAGAKGDVPKICKFVHPLHPC